MHQPARGTTSYRGLWRTDPFWFCLLIACFLGGLVLVGGCGKAGTSATLSGEVRYQGQPVEKGSIRLDPVEGGREPVATQIIGGKYSFDASSGLVAGTYRVSIFGTRVVGTTDDPETGQKVEQTHQYIPDKYNTKTVLEVTLKGGANSQNFELE